jgi:hypothetical protein
LVQGLVLGQVQQNRAMMVELVQVDQVQVAAVVQVQWVVLLEQVVVVVLVMAVLEYNYQ